MKEQSILRKKCFPFFKRHLYENGKAETMPVVTGRLVCFLFKIAFVESPDFLSAFLDLISKIIFETLPTENIPQPLLVLFPMNSDSKMALQFLAFSVPKLPSPGADKFRLIINRF